MKTPKTVIWDWNGTLADDGYASLLVVNDILAKRNMPPITMDQYYQYIDTPISRFYEHLFDLNKVPMSEITRDFQAFYPRHFQALHQGVPELLDSLRNHGIPQIILSSGYQAALERDLFRFHIAGYFDAVRLRSHVDQLKGMLNDGGVIGRKLDFLMQEMNREANTIGSKGNDVEQARNVVNIKSELEKIREQIQNIE